MSDVMVKNEGKTLRRLYGGGAVHFRKADGTLMVNATEMAKPFGKVPHDFLRLEQTKTFIAALEKSLNVTGQSNTGKSLIVENQGVTQMPIEVVKTVRGGDYSVTEPGTWLHERLALKFAAWLSVDFELWVWDRVSELMTSPDPSEGGELNGVMARKEVLLAEVKSEVAVLENALAVMARQQEVLRGYQEILDGLVAERKL